jgi:secondary thiamine-phosphate synthase enzyme
MIPIWHELNFSTRRQVDFYEITAALREDLRRSKVQNGVGFLLVPHTTAGLTINENADPDVVHDLIAALDRLAPAGAGYRHREGNSPAHIKASLMGPSLTLPVVDGDLRLGTWQGVYLCEFDGPRRRRLFVKWQEC